MKIAQRMFAIMMIALTASVFAYALDANPLVIAGALTVFSLIVPRQQGVLNFSVLFDLARPDSETAGSGGGIKSEIILIHESDVESPFPVRGIGPDAAVISSDILMKTGKFMHRFYMTQGTIKPSEKILKGSNQDCGGWQVSLEGFYPGIEKAVQAWKAQFGISFKGYIIIQNCSEGKRYLIGEPCNLAHIDNIDTTWGEEVDKEKGSKFTFTSKQGNPMAIYEGAIVYDPASPSW